MFQMNLTTTRLAIAFFALMIAACSEKNIDAQVAVQPLAERPVLQTIVIKDLEWMRCALGQSWQGDACTGDAKFFTFDAAHAAAAELNGQSGEQGKMAWRVPTIRELADLRICSKGFQGEVDTKDGGPKLREMCVDESEAPTIDGTLFPNTNKFIFWSSTPNSTYSDFAWVVFFNVGGVFDDGKKNGSGYFVRLVRSTP